MDLVTIILASILLVVLAWRWRRAKRLPPGPWNLPIVGYLPWLDPLAPYLSLTELSQKFGPVYGLYLGNVYTVVVSEASLVRKTFNKDAASGRAPLFLTHGIMKGHGLICAQGDLWKDQRKFVHNALRSFGASRVGPNRKNMEKRILENVKNFIQCLKDEGDVVTIDPLSLLRHYLGSTINSVVFGKTWGKDDPTWKWLQHLQEEGTKHIGVAGAINFLPFLRFLPNQRKIINFICDGIGKTHDLYQQIIDETPIDSDENNLIQAFIKEREKRRGTLEEKFYNNHQFHFLLADIFGASLDTTLTTLRWYLLFLAKYPNVQKKVRQQLVEVLGGNFPTLEDLSSLPYVEASIAEAQRIRPVVPVGIPHGSLESLEIGGYRVPEGAMIIPLQWAIHMDPKLWNQPDSFDPERFIDGEGKFFKPDFFIPFQAGKRMCVGDELARMFLFLFGASIVQNFELGCDDDVDLKGECGITLNPPSHKLVFTKAM